MCKSNQTYHTKPAKPNLPNQTCQTKPAKPNLPNQSCQTKTIKPNLPKQTYQTKPPKPNLRNQTYQTKATKPKLLVKAVNAWVRSAFGNVLSKEALVSPFRLKLRQIVEEDLFGHCFAWMSCLVSNINVQAIFVEDTKCQDLMKSMMSKSFVMILTVPGIWSKKYTVMMSTVRTSHYWCRTYFSCLLSHTSCW